MKKKVLGLVVVVIFLYAGRVPGDEGGEEIEVLWEKIVALEQEKNQEIAELKGRLEEIEKEKTREIEALKARLAAVERLEKRLVPWEDKRRNAEGILTKFKTSLYGFAEADFIYDTTQSFAEITGNRPVERSGTTKGENSRFQTSARNSRLGLRIEAPEYRSIRARALVEADFLGNQPSGSEASFFNNPTFRFRHYYLEVETARVTFLVGQYWYLFGWQPHFLSNTLLIQPVVGHTYGREVQGRVTAAFSLLPEARIELATSINRPPQRDAGFPAFEGGLRLIYEGLRAAQTLNSTTTRIAPFSIGVSGTFRKFKIPAHTTTGGGIAVDVFLPLLTSRDGVSRGNTLALLGEFISGTGIGDRLPDLTGNVALNSPTGQTADIDSGDAAFPLGSADFTAIRWRSFIGSFQYYFPPEGRFWLGGGYGEVWSPNAEEFVAVAGKDLYDRQQFIYGNLFYDLTEAVRLGVEYAYFRTSYVDGQHPFNHRVQGSMFFIF